MNPRLSVVLALGLAASLANILGGWIISSRPKIRQTVLNSFVSTGAGFMLAAAFLEILPRSINLSATAPVWILAGYLFVQLVEHTLSTHFHFGEETHTEEMLGARAAYSATLGLVLHAFFDGALIASGFWISMRFGILMFFAIILHKIPEGFTVASIMLASGRSPAVARAATLAISASTLAGVISAAFSLKMVGFAFPFSAGVTVYVAASDLIPEVNQASRGAISIGVFAGAALFFVTEWILNLAFGT